MTTSKHEDSRDSLLSCISANPKRILVGNSFQKKAGTENWTADKKIFDNLGDESTYLMETVKEVELDEN